MQVSIKTIRDRHATESWYPPPITLNTLGMIRNLSAGATTKFSDWKDPVFGGYIPASTNASPSTLDWVQGTERRIKTVTVSGNTAWKIDTDNSTMGLIDFSQVEANISLDNQGMFGVKGGNGTIRLSVDPLFEQDTGSLIIKYSDPLSGTGYSSRTITINKNQAGTADEFFVVPNIYQQGGQGAAYQAKIFTGSSTATPSVVGALPSWITGVSIVDDTATSSPDKQWFFNFTLQDFIGLCPTFPRRSTITIESSEFGYNVEIDVTQSKKIQGDGQLTDIDDNVYEYVEIGDYNVMLTNLRTTRYADGTTTAHGNDVPPTALWQNLNVPAYCNYNNDSYWETRYGKLYNGHTVTEAGNHGGLINGWRVPSFLELQDLIGFTVTGNIISYPNGNNFKCGTEFPLSHPRWGFNAGGNNSENWSGMPGGYRDGFTGEFKNLGISGNWWTSTAVNQSYWLFALLGGNTGNIRLSQFVPMRWGGSIRLIQDK